MKYDAQNIRARLQERLGRDPPASKHVVCLQRRTVIDVNIGKRIQTFEDQINMLTRQLPGFDLKCGLIFPIRRANPLQARFVVTIERILNQMVLQKIGLHHAGHLRCMPFLQISVSCHVCSAGHPELPT